MKGSRVASRYAKSLFAISLENSAIDIVKKDLEQIEKMCSESTDLVSLLHSPVVKFDKKTEILKIIFPSLSTQTQQFVAFLCEKRREDSLRGIIQEFFQLYKKHNNIETIVLTTAHPLNTTSKSNIDELIKNIVNNPIKKIDLITKVKEDLIGGFIIEIQDKRLDTSVKQTLNLLKREFEKNHFITSN